MNTQPKVSVIVPVYNAEKYLPECLDSLIHQTLKEIEIICVDDGSTDGSVEIVKAYQEKDGRISLLHQQHEFAGAARNRGMDAGKGEYIAFLDADDFYALDGLEKLYEKAVEHDLDMIKGSSWLMNMKTGETATTRYYSHGGFDLKNQVVNFKMAPQKCLDLRDVAWNGLYRRSLIQEKGLRFNNLQCVNDRSFFIACVLNFQRIMVVDTFLTTYRTHLSESLVGIRHQKFECQIASYYIIKDIARKAGVSKLMMQRILQGELKQIFAWHDMFTAQSVDMCHVEDVISQFVKELDVSDVGEDHVRNFPWAHTFERMRQRAKIVYATELPDIKISVIIPCYNSVAYLCECLDSVLGQNFREFEIICIDDGSSDATLDMLREYARRDCRMVVLQQNHGYAGRARNLGMEHARGDYFTFIDSDDKIQPGFLKELYDEAQKHQADVVVTKRATWDGKRRAVPPGNYAGDHLIPQHKPFSTDDYPDYILTFTTGAPGGKLFSKAFIEAENLTYPPLPRSEDFFFVLGAVVYARRVVLVNTCKYLYRTNNINSLESTKDRTPMLFWDATLQFKDELIRRGYFDRIKRSWNTSMLVRFSYNLGTVKQYESYQAIFEKLREIKDTEIELENHPREYFFETSKYDEVKQMLAFDVGSDYLLAEVKRLQKQVNRLNWEMRKNEKSARVGRMVLYLPRLIKRGVNCVKNNGVVITAEKAWLKIKFFVKKRLIK